MDLALSTLRARFVRTVDVDPEHHSGYAIAHVETFAEAQGVEFLCPGCWAANGGPVGTHEVIVWFMNRNVPDEVKPSPRWGAAGDAMDRLTLVPSVDVDPDGRHCWHGFINRGHATNA